ncbi:MAG: universal stress protein [Dehalococcoidia bacterium]
MRLMVAFDGSEGARAALREAASLARETGAPVVLAQVLQPLIDAAKVMAPTTAEAMKTVEAQTRAALEAVAKEFELDAAATEIVVESARRGEDDAEALERIAAEQSATMIVISSRRAASVVGTLLGSVTSHVIRHAPCPVLVVRE